MSLSWLPKGMSVMHTHSAMRQPSRAHSETTARDLIPDFPLFRRSSTNPPLSQFWPFPPKTPNYSSPVDHFLRKLFKIHDAVREPPLVAYLELLLAFTAAGPYTCCLFFSHRYRPLSLPLLPSHLEAMSHPMHQCLRNPPPPPPPSTFRNCDCLNTSKTFFSMAKCHGIGR